MMVNYIDDVHEHKEEMRGAEKQPGLKCPGLLIKPVAGHGGRRIFAVTMPIKHNCLVIMNALVSALLPCLQARANVSAFAG